VDHLHEDLNLALVDLEESVSPASFSADANPFVIILTTGFEIVSATGGVPIVL
jgi:hypothetical protein